MIIVVFAKLFRERHLLTINRALAVEDRGRKHSRESTGACRVLLGMLTAGCFLVGVLTCGVLIATGFSWLLENPHLKRTGGWMIVRSL